MNQKKYFEELLKLKPSGFDPYVETHRETEEGLEYSSWNEYENGIEHIDERSVFPNEIVVDIDEGDTEERRKKTKQICTILETQGLKHFVADTGGTGFHIHIFFEIPESVESDELRSYRIALYNWLKAKVEEETQVDPSDFDDSVVDFDTSMSKGHLVRAVGGRKIDTGHIKTVVNSSTLKKKEAQALENVEYPQQLGFWKISKLDDSKADLTWKDVTDKAKTVKEQEYLKRKEKLESEWESSDDGLDALREVPATEVLKMLGREHQQGESIFCPCHDDKPSKAAKITDGTESEQMPANRLICFSDTCTEDSNFRLYNAIDILMENGRSFPEAKEELAEEFDIELPEEKNFSVDDFHPADFRPESEDSPAWDYQELADVIEDFESFKYLSEDDTDQLFIKENGIWKEKGESTVTNYCMSLTNEQLYSQRAINNVLRLIKNRNRIYQEEDFFQPPEMLIPFNNGVYDVEKDEFRDFREDDNFLFKHEIDYVEDLGDAEDEGKVMEFLDTIVDTERKKQILLECAGLAMLPSYPIDKAPILFGEGGNGKGVYVDMLEKMLGNYHEINLEDFTDDDFASSEIENTTFVFFDEFEKVGDVSKVKSFIGNEEIRVRKMHQEGYLAKQIAFPILAANSLPKPPERKPSFFRRFEIVDFPYRFTDKDDEFKDMKPKTEIENKYWTEEALNCFATKAAQTVSATVERQGFSDGQSVEEVQHRWEARASPVYNFLNHFVEQGELPNQGTAESADVIVKEVLLDMANEYLESVKGGNVQMYELTQAIENSPDLTRGNDQPVDVGDSKTKMGYSGLVLTLPSFDDLGDLLHLQSSRIKSLVMEYWQHFDDLESRQGAQIVEIVKTPLHQKVLNYLDMSENDRASLLEVIKALDLDEDQIPEVMASEFVKQVDRTDGEFMYPILEFDREALDKAVEQSEEVSKVSGSVKPVSRWVGDKVNDLTQNQRVDVQDYFIDPGKEQGYSENKIEETIEEMKSEGELFDPEPGKIEVL